MEMTTSSVNTANTPAAIRTEEVPERRERVEGEVGLGVDIVEIARMKRILERTPSFKEKVFSAEERAYCDSKAKPEIHYATRFAAREAVLKALGTGFSQGIRACDVTVARNAKGKPRAVLLGKAAEVAKELGVIELPLSLSYTHSDAVACAMAITRASVQAAETRVDPMEELAAQFKEARALLDEPLPVASSEAAQIASSETALASSEAAPAPEQEA